MGFSLFLIFLSIFWVNPSQEQIVKSTSQDNISFIVFLHLSIQNKRWAQCSESIIIFQSTMLLFHHSQQVICNNHSYIKQINQQYFLVFYQISLFTIEISFTNSSNQKNLIKEIEASFGCANQGNYIYIVRKILLHSLNLYSRGIYNSITEGVICMTQQAKKFFQQAQIIRQPSQALNQLWISGQHFAHNIHALKEHNIKAVCSVGSHPFTFPPQIKQLYLEVEDSPDEDITRIFDIAFDFIEKQRIESNVLVHCVAGVSRSASVVAYYLMRRYRWSLGQSLQRIREARPFVCPNEGFYTQLRAAESGLGLRIVLGRF